MNVFQASRDLDREQIIRRARELRNSIEQIFCDCNYWNVHDRKQGEAPIDPDPDGRLRLLADGLDRMLAADTGEGPIAPILNAEDLATIAKEIEP